MNRNQQEMLSVKSAIERTIQGLVTSYSQAPLPNPYGLYEEICRYMASLFASRQIDQDYQVERKVDGRLDITFRTHDQISSLSFLPPPHQPSPLANLAQEQEPLGREFEEVLHNNLDQLYEETPSVEDAFEYAKKFTR